MDWLKERATERTTYIGAVIALLGLFGLDIDTKTATEIASGIAAIVGVVLVAMTSEGEGDADRAGVSQVTDDGDSTAGDRT